MNVNELAAWLRANSSGIYRPAADAADMLLSLAAENERLKADVPRWWTCSTHGDTVPQNAWGCPRCTRELRIERDRLAEALRDLLAVAPSKPPAAGLIVGIEDRHRAAIDAARAALAAVPPKVL